MAKTQDENVMNITMRFRVFPFKFPQPQEYDTEYYKRYGKNIPVDYWSKFTKKEKQELLNSILKKDNKEMKENLSRDLGFFPIRGGGNFEVTHIKPIQIDDKLYIDTSITFDNPNNYSASFMKNRLMGEVEHLQSARSEVINYGKPFYYSLKDGIKDISDMSEDKIKDSIIMYKNLKEAQDSGRSIITERNPILLTSESIDIEDSDFWNETGTNKLVEQPSKCIVM